MGSQTSLARSSIRASFTRSEARTKCTIFNAISANSSFYSNSSNMTPVGHTWSYTLQCTSVGPVSPTFGYSLVASFSRRTVAFGQTTTPISGPGVQRASSHALPSDDPTTFFLIDTSFDTSCYTEHSPSIESQAMTFTVVDTVQSSDLP